MDYEQTKIIQKRVQIIWRSGSCRLQPFYFGAQYNTVLNTNSPLAEVNPDKDLSRF